MTFEKWFGATGSAAALCALVAACGSTPAQGDAPPDAPSAAVGTALPATADAAESALTAPTFEQSWVGEDLASDGSDSATLVVRGEPGSVVWFERREREERTFGTDDDTYVSEVRTLFSVEIEKGTVGGTGLAVHFVRIHGHVEDFDRLEFDTATVVPDVYCRLDDVQGDIALEGVTVRISVAPDGKFRLRSVLGADGMPALGALDAAVASLHSILGENVRRGAPVALGESWTGKSAFGFGAPFASVAVQTRTTVERIGADAVLLAVAGEAVLTPPAASGEGDDGSAASRPDARGGTTWRARLSVSRHDGLIVKSVQEVRNTVGRGDDRLAMRHAVRTVVTRIPAPAGGE